MTKWFKGSVKIQTALRRLTAGSTTIDVYEQTVPKWAYDDVVAENERLKAKLAKKGLSSSLQWTEFIWGCCVIAVMLSIAYQGLAYLKLLSY